MSNWPRRKKRALGWQIFALTVSLCLSGYFAYHTVSGRYGLEVRDKLVLRVSILEFETASLEKIKSRLSKDIALLSPEKPDADLVQEIARDHLGYVHPNERVIQLH